METIAKQHDLLLVGEVATMLRCSTRTVYRSVELGKLPRPAKFGKLNRWPRAIVEQWITDGCPSCDSEVAK